MGPLSFSLQADIFLTGLVFSRIRFTDRRKMRKIGPLLQNGQLKKFKVPSHSDVFIVLNEMFNYFYKRHVNYKNPVFIKTLTYFMLIKVRIRCLHCYYSKCLALKK